MYQIVKGWPAASAIDEVLTPAADVDLEGGVIASIDADGNAIVGNYAADGSDAGAPAAFVIDKDEVTGKFTGLMSQAMIEVDANHYAEDTYAPGDDLTATTGAFAKPSVGGSERVIAKVRSINATTGVMRVLWFGC